MSSTTEKVKIINIEAEVAADDIPARLIVKNEKYPDDPPYSIPVSSNVAIKWRGKKIEGEDQYDFLYKTLQLGDIVFITHKYGFICWIEDYNETIIAIQQNPITEDKNHCATFTLIGEDIHLLENDLDLTYKGTGGTCYTDPDTLVEAAGSINNRLLIIEPEELLEIVNEAFNKREKEND